MFGKRLVVLRKQKGISQYELANQLDLSRGQLSNYELETREPDFETLRKITNYFDVSADYILGFSDNLKENGTVYKVPSSKKLPVLGAIRSGLPLLADENITEHREVPDYMQADFILYIKDDSMEGSGILKGDYVLCRIAEAVNPGQAVVAAKDLKDGFTEEIIRFYIEESQGFILRAANPLYPDINVVEDYTVIGIIVAQFRQDIPLFQNCLYANVSNSEAWTEIIDLTSQAGLNVKQVKDILLGQIEIFKKLSELY